MATQVQFRKGTQSEIDAFTGANAEIVVNTSNNSVVVQNGSTAGGFEAMRSDLANANAGSAALTTASLTTGALTATTLNVNGLVTSDGLTVDGNARIEELGAIAKLTLERGGTANDTDSAAVDLLETNAGSEGANFGDAATNGFRLKLDGSANDFLIQSGASGTVNTRFGIDRDTGAATFYGTVTAEDTSLTGSSSGSTVLTLTSNALADTPLMVFQRTGGAVAGKLAYEDGNTAMSFGTTTAHELKLLTNNTNRLEIDSSGNATFAGSVSVGNITVDTNTISSTNSNGNIIISPNGTGNVNVNTDVLAIQGTEGEGPSLALQADESDDAGDEWRFTTNTDQTLSIKNNISGSEVDYITLTPHATVASSTATFAGGVIVNAGNGNQLTLNNGGERFTQLTLKENGSTQGGLWLDGTDNYVDLYANTSHGIRLKTGGDNTRVTIDENGMMGLGTTPENAFVAYKTFEIGRDFAIYGSTSAQHGGSFSNVYLDAPGNYKRKNEGQSTFLNQIGQYEWYTVAYDAADATITWGSAKMTLTNDGKLGIGVAPSRRKLEVSDSSPGIVFRDTGVTGLYHEIVGGGDTGLELWADNGDVSSGTFIRFGVDGEERARIHPGGTLELTVPDAYTTLKLTPTGTNANATLDFNTPGNGDGVIQVQGTEVLRVHSDHNVDINDGFLRMSNGYGVYFGAAASGNTGETSHSLDAYEEGTWTPQLWGYGSTQLGTSVDIGEYTRIGNMCYAAFRIQVDDLNSVSASYMLVVNLPFAHPNADYGWSGVVNYFSGLNYDVSGLAWDISSTSANVWLTAVIGTDGHGSSGSSFVGSSYMTSSTMLKGMLVYRVS